MVKLSKKEKKVINDIVITPNENKHTYDPETNTGDISIDFDILWSGDLQGYYIDGSKNDDDKTTSDLRLESRECFDAALFICMSNKLVYKVEFKVCKEKKLREL